MGNGEWKMRERQDQHGERGVFVDVGVGAGTLGTSVGQKKKVEGPRSNNSDAPQVPGRRRAFAYYKLSGRKYKPPCGSAIAVAHQASNPVTCAITCQGFTAPFSSNITYYVAENSQRVCASTDASTFRSCRPTR